MGISLVQTHWCRAAGLWLSHWLKFLINWVKFCTWNKMQRPGISGMRMKEWICWDFRDKHLCFTGTTITKDMQPRKPRRQWKLQKRYFFFSLDLRRYLKGKSLALLSGKSWPGLSSPNETWKGKTTSQGCFIPDILSSVEDCSSLMYPPFPPVALGMLRTGGDTDRPEITVENQWKSLESKSWSFQGAALQGGVLRAGWSLYCEKVQSHFLPTFPMFTQEFCDCCWMVLVLSVQTGF